MSFEDKIKQLIEHQVHSQPVNVLVWGPGEGARRDYEKRRKIQYTIKSTFPNAEVRFSEELTDAVPGAADLTAPELELYHLAACDLCVVLDSSQGPGEEIAHFGRTNFAYKLLVLTHERHKDSSSFPRSLRKHLNQVFYNDDEYDSCVLVERVLNRVRYVALGRMAGLSA
ncbi:MAG TPA: hypothetical protein VJH03_07210 [Blastocatellia bacterium]|nr:hypothetical protein [Blastocatellia bacterium]